MAAMRACGAKGAKGGSSHCGGGAGRCGKQATSGAVAESARAINARVCGHARDGDVQGLLDYAASRRHHMNHVNLTTTMHKLAQMAKDGGAAFHLGDWRFAVLHDRVRMFLTLQSRESLLPGAEVVPRCWSTLAWSYATLSVPGLHLQPVFDVIAELSVPNLAAFNMVELTNLVWAFAKAEVSNVHLFQAARAHIAANLASLSPSHISTLVWSMVTAKHDQASTLCELTESFVRQMGTQRVDPIAISNLMWGLATAKVHPRMALLERIGNDASKLLPAFKPQELSITTWAFSRLDVCHDRLFAAVAERLRRDLGVQQWMHGQGLANLMWAFNRQRALGSGAGAQLRWAMQAMLPRCAALLGQFKAQEFSCICQSLQESGIQHGTCLEASAFWDMASGLGRAQAHDGPGTPPQPRHQKFSEAAVETASTGTGDSGPHADSDAESQDGDGLGMLRSDMCDGGTVGSAAAPCTVDHSTAALHHRCAPMHIGVGTMAAAADDAARVLQVPPPAKQVSLMQPFQREALHSLGTSAPPVHRPDQREAAGDVLSHRQPQPQQAPGNADLQAGLVFENQVCYIVKNTFIEEAEADTAAGPVPMYASEPPPRADFGVGQLLKFPKLRQRPAHRK